MLKDRLLYDYALSHVGLPYLWGGDDPLAGFDCSGLVVELLKSCGIFPKNYDNTAQGIYRDLVEESTRVIYPTFGALCFYGKGLGSITHIAFAMDEYRMLEAGGGGSKTRTAEDAQRQNAFIRIRPVNARRDLVAMLFPGYHLAKDKA